MLVLLDFLSEFEIFDRIKHVICGVANWGWIFILKYKLKLLLE